MNINNDDLINELKNLGYLKSKELISALSKYKREYFLEDSQKEKAYLNIPIKLENNKITPSPTIVSFLLELLELRAGDKVLEIGSGIGWQSALICDLIKHERGLLDDKDGRYGMISLEEDEASIGKLENNLSKFDFFESSIVKIVFGEYAKGFEEDAPYDKIIIWHEVDQVSKSWNDQLVIGGEIGFVSKKHIVVMTKLDKNSFSTKQFYGFSID